MSIRNFSFFYLFLGATCMAQVSLTEIGAISSERLISRNEAGIQRLGSGAQWFDLDFDDSRWEVGANPIGYGFETPVTDVREAIEGKTPTLYYRQTFTLTAEQAASTETLSLEMDYNDGYVAYLNGMELRRRFCAAEGAYLYHDQPAFGTVRSTDSPNTFSFTDSSNYLREGENVLAVEIHNASLDSPELKLATALQTPSTTLIAAGASGRWFPGVISPSGGVFDPAFLNLSEEEKNAGLRLEFSDWVELTNETAEPVDLSDWSLSDNPATPRGWVFPAGTTIPANGQLLLIADGSGATGDYLHTNFRLSASGETLQLFNPASVLISEIPGGYPQQYVKYSYGTSPETGEWSYLAYPTPGKENTGTALSDRVDAPDFSPKGGVFTETAMVTLTSDTPGALIRYTTDHTEPTLENGIDYTGPIEVTRISSRRARVIRARAFKEGQISSRSKIHSYLVSQDRRLLDVPALLFSAPPAETFYDRHGIMSIVGGRYVDNNWEGTTPTSYNNPMVRGSNMERQLQVEYYQPNGTGFRLPGGIRLSASSFTRPRLVLNDTRRSPWPSSEQEKTSFNLFFRNDYGDDKIDFPILGEDYPVDQFSQLRIRSGKNDNRNPFIVDETVRRLFSEMGQESSVGVINSLYVNGNFKGFYNLCERLREPFMQAHYNSSKDWDVRQVDDYASGDDEAWSAMMTALGEDLTDLTKWQAAEQLLDPVNMADYFILNTYGATWDWPHNNWVGARERSDEGKYRLHIWDAEGAFAIFSYMNKVDRSTIAQDLLSKESALPLLFQRLVRSPEWRLTFADRINRHFFNGGVLDDRNPDESRFVKISEELRNQLEPLLNLVLRENPTETYLTNWISPTVGRRRFLLGPTRNDFSDSGLWPSTSPPQFSQHGGSLSLATPLTITADTGDTIYYTLDGSDPRLAGGTQNTNSFTYTTGITFAQGTSTVKSRAFDAATGEWSALTEADFSIGLAAPTATNLVISEIMYHPPSPSVSEDAAGFGDEGDFEFIELSNISASETLDLSGLSFVGAITFDFPALTLGPGEKFYLAGNLQAFDQRYAKNAQGLFSGQLSNSSETLTLKNGDTVIHRLTYSDQSPWPECADGPGYSLLLVNAESAPDHSLPESWVCSTHFGGELSGDFITLDYSRWADFNLDEDSLISLGNPLDDADGDGAVNQLEFAMGTSPLKDDVSLPTLAMETSGLPLFQFQIPAQDLPLTYLIEESANLEDGWTTTASEIVSTILNPDNTRTRTYRIMKPFSSEAVNFYRLKVSD